MYVVLEMQTNNGTVAVLTSTHNTFAEAQSKYYTVLAYAAVSTIDAHSALLCDNHGVTLMSQGFIHESEGE